jgi:hypothetical protein
MAKIPRDSSGSTSPTISARCLNVKDAMDEQRFRKENGLCDVKVNIHHSLRETNKSQAECPFLEGDFYLVLRIEPQS